MIVGKLCLRLNSPVISRPQNLIQDTAIRPMQQNVTSKGQWVRLPMTSIGKPHKTCIRGSGEIYDHASFLSFKPKLLCIPDKHWATIYRHQPPVKMKYTRLSILAILLSALQADAQCVEGHRETISPGFAVEYKCDLYRKGTTHKSIGSHRDCASLCEAMTRDVCSYHPPTQICIVGNDGGHDVSRSGVTLMRKVDDKDPFEDDDDDPFETCEEKLAKCKGNAGSPGPSPEDIAQSSCKVLQLSSAERKLNLSGPARDSKPSTIGGKEYKIWCGRSK